MLLAITIHIFWSSGYLVDYYTDMDAYKALCVNKDKPALQCDGKCILAQKIAAADQAKSQKDEAELPPIPVVSTQYMIAAFTMIFDLPNLVMYYQQYWQEPYFKSFIKTIFKPPT